jgi:hypothetical protein
MPEPQIDKLAVPRVQLKGFDKPGSLFPVYFFEGRQIGFLEKYAGLRTEKSRKKLPRNR